MRRSVLVVLAAIFATGALAQSGSGSNAPPPPSGQQPLVQPGQNMLGSAPVGHRQPRRSDVQGNDNDPFQRSPEDIELDRRIKSICRGC